MTSAPQRILVTSALPYANGHIHLGHVVEYVQTDVWVRFQRLMGRRCVYLCADDTHGASIMLRARHEGRPETAIIAEMQAAHERDFAGFDISVDYYGSTHSEENRQLSGEFWQALRQAGLVQAREVQQLFDPQAGMFLADRFVKGTCPKCGAADQYGDNCEKCQATYRATELIDPVSTVSGAKPEIRDTRQLFVTTEQYHEFLDEWTQTGNHVHPDVAHWLKSTFLSGPLRDWDVSRPAPYFGFEIPNEPGNYWYVWFDAPIGYVAATLAWCRKTGEDFNAWWRDPATSIHHFIGKDITYFHTLFWPVMLRAAGLTLPTHVHIHGFLTVGGEKMSKSKGTFVRASTYLQHLDPTYLRYYYATKLTPKLDDLDLNLEEFVARVNGDLVNKVVNLASRTARFVQATGLSAAYPDDGGLFQQAAADGAEIAAAYEACDYNRAMRAIMLLADRANKYVEDQAPWSLKKDPAQAERLQQVCTVALSLFRQIAVYLAPVLPRLAAQASELLHDPIVSWDQAQRPLVGTRVGPFKHMLQRVELSQVQAMIEDSIEKAPGTAPAAPADGGEHLAAEPLAPQCVIDDFLKVDLRVARVLSAEAVTESKKLLRLTLCLGGDERRQVFAGIKSVYDPAQLVGQLVICVANLAPRTMKFGTSEGMVVAAGAGGTDIFLLRPDSGAKPGMRVH